jgi:hypothetical protein
MVTSVSVSMTPWLFNASLCFASLFCGGVGFYGCGPVVLKECVFTS